MNNDKKTKVNHITHIKTRIIADEKNVKYHILYIKVIVLHPQQVTCIIYLTYQS